MRTIAILAALLLATPAQAWSFCDGWIMPPVEHQREPEIDYAISTLLPEDVTFMCELGWVDPRLLGGCVVNLGVPDRMVTIFVRNDLTPEETGCVIFHELSHIPPNNFVHAAWDQGSPDLSAESMAAMAADYRPRPRAYAGK